MKLSLKDLASMCGIAKEAGDAIMRIYKGDYEVGIKEDESPVTVADIIADQIIRTGLKTKFPGIPIVSEESSEINQVAADTRTFFLVDPLDGTKEFIRRSSEFTVNIALIHDSRAIAGVVLAPALDTMYFASSVHGAWSGSKFHDGIKIESSSSSNSNLKVIGSRSHGSQEMQNWLSTLKCQYSLLTAGSSLKFCRVAEGVADVYPRLAPTSQWDTAAAQCILEATGGNVQDINGNPLKYGLDRPILNPSFFALGKGITI
jgi:3'(2'), 5'-bisphosphate nucleotidase